MDKQKLLDELSGIGVPPETISKQINEAENRLLGRLVKNFGLTQKEAGVIIPALYRFKKTYGYYVQLWEETGDKLTPPQKDFVQSILGNTKSFIDHDSRRCFSNATFFCALRHLLYECKVKKMPLSEEIVHLKRVCNFRIILADSIKQLMEDSCWPTCLPHVYMYRSSGFLRRLIERGIPRKEITREFNFFLWEHNVGSAHTRWFNKRFAGSYGSRQ